MDERVLKLTFADGQPAARDRSAMKNIYHHAAVLEGPQSVCVKSMRLPEIAPHQIRVRLRGCGICGSNLPVWEGRPWFKYPLEPGAPGHEGWGIVDAVGGTVDHLRAGDRVAVLSYHAFAEHDVVDGALALKMPDVAEDAPFPGEALGCAVNVFRRAKIVAGEWVAVVGVGFLGALLVQLAAKNGAKVIALSRRKFSLDIAERMGARQTLQIGETSESATAAAAAVREITGGAGCSCVIEATGLQSALDLATELTAERGRLIIAGYHQDGLRQVNMQLWNWRGLDVINAHERDSRVYVQGMKEAAALIVDGTLNPSPLYTHRYDLGSLNRAFTDMRDRESGFLKGLLIYD
ncbi:MAG TPA: zinc-binding dehydrogenase [Opitutaceae bacterium]|nr:zinc-binding dehydrogenase [Opitutaceae bacterium]